jgi:hypothetical protein
MESELANAKFWLFWLNVAKTIGGVSVFVAIGIEVAADWVAEPFREKIEHARELQIADANARAEEAKAEQERLKARLQWRTLDRDQERSLWAALDEAGLRGSLTKFVLTWPSGDPEAETYARWFLQFFGNGWFGWSYVPNIVNSPPRFGLIFVAPKGEPDEVLEPWTRAFAKAGLLVTANSQWRVNAIGIKPDQFQFIVGHKPPPS